VTVLGLCPYSPECMEGVFSEVRLVPILCQAAFLCTELHSLRPSEGPVCNRRGLLAYLILQTHEERMRTDEAKGKAEGRRRTERSKRMGLLGGSGGKDKDEGTMDKAKGRMKEGAGALTGDKKLKREGSSDQRKGKTKQKKGDLKDLLP
jgi:uncharacterized protein YjbJ (UPF0337 family)